MTTFEISETKKPVSPIVGRGGSRSYSKIYPFAEMQVGDHFDIPKTHRLRNGHLINKKAIQTAMHYWRRKHAPDRKFVFRNIPEENVFRIWRTE